MTTNMKLQRSAALSTLERLYGAVRAATAALMRRLSDADATVSVDAGREPDANGTWPTPRGLETMVLIPNCAGYRVFDENFKFLFNSYYESVGERQPRPLRGLITRPTLAEILDYRRHVDSAMTRLFRQKLPPGVIGISELGCLLRTTASKNCC